MEVEKIDRVPSNCIQFREFKKSDWEGVHKYASQETVCRTQPWGPNSVEETFEYVDQVLMDAEKVPRTRFAFAVVHTEDDEMIGAGELRVKSSLRHSWLLNRQSRA